MRSRIQCFPYVSKIKHYVCLRPDSRLDPQYRFPSTVQSLPSTTTFNSQGELSQSTLYSTGLHKLLQPGSLAASSASCEGLVQNYIKVQQFSKSNVLLSQIILQLIQASHHHHDAGLPLEEDSHLQCCQKKPPFAGDHQPSLPGQDQHIVLCHISLLTG